MSERFLEKIGILKHQLTLEESEAAVRMCRLTADYLTERIELERYKSERDRLLDIDVEKLAHDLNYKG